VTPTSGLATVFASRHRASQAVSQPRMPASPHTERQHPEEGLLHGLARAATAAPVSAPGHPCIDATPILEAPAGACPVQPAFSSLGAELALVFASRGHDLFHNPLVGIRNRRRGHATWVTLSSSQGDDLSPRVRHGAGSLLSGTRQLGRCSSSRGLGHISRPEAARHRPRGPKSCPAMTAIFPPPRWTGRFALAPGPAWSSHKGASGRQDPWSESITFNALDGSPTAMIPSPPWSGLLKFFPELGPAQTWLRAPHFATGSGRLGVPDRRGARHWPLPARRTGAAIPERSPCRRYRLARRAGTKRVAMEWLCLSG